MDPLGTAYLRDLALRLPRDASSLTYQQYFEALAQAHGAGVAMGLTPLTRERFLARCDGSEPAAEAVYKWLFDDWLRFAGELAANRSVHGLARRDDLFDVLLTKDTLHGLRIGRPLGKAPGSGASRASTLFDWARPATPAEEAAGEAWREHVRARVRYSVAEEAEYLGLDPKNFAMPLVVLEARLVATEEVEPLIELRGPLRTASSRRAEIEAFVLTATDHPMSRLRDQLRRAGVPV